MEGLNVRGETDNEWEEVELGDVLETLESGSRPKGGVDKIKRDIPSIGGEHLTNDGKFYFEKIKYISQAFYNSMKRGKIKKDDVLIVKDGATTGKTSFVNEMFPYKNSAVNEHVFIARTKKTTLPEWLFYYLFSSDGQLQIRKNIRGSAQGGINKSILDEIKIPLPPLPEQKAISKILSSLDSKIEYNKMINKILEEIGREIFKKWFVDGESNTIPAKDVIDFKRGIEVGSNNYFEIQEKGTMPFYRVADIKDINTDYTKTFVKKDLLQDGTFNNNDILVSFDGTVGRVFIGGQGGYSSGIRKLTIKKPDIYKKSFVYFWAKSSSVQRTINKHATGTIILHAGKGIDFLKIQSKQDLIKKFNDASLPLFKKLLNNILEIQILSKIRDLLLPKLMTGKIRVPVGGK